MSHLRDHLDAAANQHRSLRYPGDLASDVLDRPVGRIGPRRVVKFAAGFLVGGATAAAVMFALRASHSQTGRPWIARPTVAVNKTGTDTQEQIALSPGEVPSWTEVATSTTFSASSPTFTFVGAEASSFDDENSSQDSSTSDDSTTN